jgi:hypothetical protein
MEKISLKAKRFLPGNPNARNLEHDDTSRISINRSLETGPRCRRKAQLLLWPMWVAAMPERPTPVALVDVRRSRLPPRRPRPE